MATRIPTPEKTSPQILTFLKGNGEISLIAHSIASKIIKCPMLNYPQKRKQFEKICDFRILFPPQLVYWLQELELELELWLSYYRA